MNISEILAGLSASESEAIASSGPPQWKGVAGQVFEAGDDQMVEVMNAGSWLQSKGAVAISEVARKVYSIKDARRARARPAGTACPCAPGQTWRRGRDKGSFLRAIQEEASIALGWLRRRIWPRSPRKVTGRC